MSELRKIINNTLISLVGQLVTWTSTLGLTIAYGRFLGDVKFGELYFATMFVGLIGFPVEFGFNQQLTRDVATDPEKAHAYLWNTLLIKMTLWITLYGGILLTAKGLGYSQEQWDLVAICGVNLMVGSVVSTFAALHYAFSRTVFPSVGMMIEKGLDAVVGFILLKNGASVQTMAFVLLGGSIIDGIWVALWFFRLTGWRLTFDRVIIIDLFRSSIPFVAYGILGVIYYRIDTVLLSLMANTAVVGWYGAGYRLFDTLLFVPNLIINAIMYPIFAKLSTNARSQSTLKLAIEKSMNLLLICSIPIATLMIVGAPNIIGFLYHRAEFANSIPVLQALAPGLVFLYINTLLSSIIVSTKGEKKIPLMAAIALVFNLGTNLLLIPLYKQVGAALVTSLTELLLLCTSMVIIQKQLLPGKSIRVASKALVSALVMAAAIYLLRSLSILFITPVAFLAYAGSAFLLRTIPREDMQFLLKAVKNKGKKKGISVELLANIVDENIYDQITNPYLPAVYGQTTDYHLSIVNARTVRLEALVAERDDDITLLLPVVKIRKARPKMILEDDDPTLEISAVKTRKVPTVQSRETQPEVVRE
ncbi:MAG: flippase [Ktedonobacteraceae bacterium]